MYHCSPGLGFLFPTYFLSFLPSFLPSFLLSSLSFPPFFFLSLSCPFFFLLSLSSSLSTCLVAQSCLTLCGPMNPPGSFAHGIFQARILAWGAISYSRRSSQLRDWTHTPLSSTLAGGFFTTRATWEDQASKVYV